jgi:GNAT superfamily N-acetyltransferase
MLSKKEHRPRRTEDPRFYVAEASVKQWQFNRFLYVLVGREWTWTSKLVWSDAQWVEYAESNSLRTFPAYYDGSPAGYFELSRSPENEVELAAFGLAPKFIGRGFGGSLLSTAIEKSWEMEPSRVWLHTCELDHPRALGNYLARGFSVYKVDQE